MHPDLDRRLLAALADGQFHSGVELAERLGVSRGAIWQHVRALIDQRLDIYAVRGKGYRLNPAIELLDVERIREGLTAFARRALIELEVHPVVDSTNSRLLLAAPPVPGRFIACLAEYQTTGQGRRGRRWLSPFAGGLCLSLACQFKSRHAQFSTLSLAIGVAVSRALAACGVSGIQLKWPNDLVAGDRKLGGILVQMKGEAIGAAHLVIGVGLNVTGVPERVTGAALQPVALHDLAGGRVPGRNTLAAELISSITSALDEFGRRGFAPFTHEWHEADYLAGKQVRVDSDVLAVSGTAVGVGESGALRVETDGRVREFVSGEVTVRPWRPES